MKGQMRTSLAKYALAEFQPLAHFTESITIAVSQVEVKEQRGLSSLFGG